MTVCLCLSGRGGASWFWMKNAESSFLSILTNNTVSCCPFFELFVGKSVFLGLTWSKNKSACRYSAICVRVVLQLRLHANSHALMRAHTHTDTHHGKRASAVKAKSWSLSLWRCALCSGVFAFTLSALKSHVQNFWTEEFVQSALPSVIVSTLKSACLKNWSLFDGPLLIYLFF